MITNREAYEALGRLVTFLGDERPEYAGIAVPVDADERWSLARSLMNMRPPNPIPLEVLADQDLVLHARQTLVGTTDAHVIPAVASDDRIALWQGDITTLAVDAIVNAANMKLLGCFIPGHHCIDNAIHTFAGMQLRLACAEIMQRQAHDEPVGTAKVTPAFNLPSRFIVHTVGPQTNGMPTRDQETELAHCYTACLNAAADRGCESIAFCCISTGEFRFPRDLAARIAIDTVRTWVDTDGRIKQVVFNVFSDEDERVYRALLG